MSKLWHIDPEAPDEKAIEASAREITAGNQVIIPTRCLYGIATDAFNAKAVRTLFNTKKRVKSNPILVLIHKEDQLRLLAERIPSAAKKLMAHFWPGRLTIIFRARKEVPPEITAHTGKVGVRLVGHPVTGKMIRYANTPVTGTSANISGEKGVSRIQSLDPQIYRSVSGILNAGPLLGGKGSTVIDITQSPFKIVREGGVSQKEINICLGQE